MVYGGGACERCLGRKSITLMSGISALITETRGTYCSFHHVRILREDDCEPESGPSLDIKSASIFTLDFSAPEL